MKKVVSVFMMLVLMIGALAACGPKEESGGSSTGGKKEEKGDKLVVWEDKDKSVWLKDVVGEFEKEHGVKVEIKEVPMADKMRDQLRLDGPAGTGPDVITLPHDQIGQVATEGLIAELKVSGETKELFSETSIAAQTFDGKLYGLPKSAETPVFIYNKALMKEVPKTMEDLYTFAKENTKGESYGFLALFDNYYFAHAPIGGNGGYVFKEDNGTLDPKDVGLNNEGAVKGTEFIQKWYTEGLFPKGIVGENGGSAMDGLFNEGKVASVMNGPWAFGAMEEAGIDYGVAPLPKFADGTPMKTFMGVKGYHVSAFSKNQELATKFVEFITNDENSKIRFEKTKEVPTNVALIEDPAIAENEGAKAVALQTQDAVPMPNVPEMAEVWKPMADALQTVVTGKAEPKAALDSAVKQIGQNIEANHSK
ncbi:sugar ABC transporter substrate-binding protein [Bacillus sp. T33-2]|uniref:sugar ABC transporter substrate-binding protein n=1 Tax=Bacillus sp. T33-2 TaxID=2054168 RepID=UPI000C7632FB|nr:extracellular solute-binding protein [Bacillus sp. T33-2]PLR97663.1 cyclodextrin-binding protein [Bacillus sp. T33-2]